MNEVKYYRMQMSEAALKLLDLLRIEMDDNTVPENQLAEWDNEVKRLRAVASHVESGRRWKVYEGLAERRASRRGTASVLRGAHRPEDPSSS